MLAFRDVARVRLARSLTTLRGGSGNLARSKSVISIFSGAIAWKTQVFYEKSKQQSHFEELSGEPNLQFA